MQVNQPMQDRNSQDLRLRPSNAPRCYTRAVTSADIDQARTDRQCTAALMLLSVTTCAALFVVAYGGWGF